MKKLFNALAVLLCLLQASCGYHFIGQKSEMLAGIQAIAIPYFENKSFEPGLERYVTDALVDEFVKSRILAVVDEAGADAVIRGRIEELSESVISYDKDDRALEYRALITLDITLERKGTGEIIWRNKALSHFEEYRVAPEIAATETNKKIALQIAAAELAERIHDSIIEGF